MIRNFIVATVLFPLLVGLVNAQTPIPKPSCGFNCSEQNTSSPWNFWLDFETDEWKQKLKVNDKGNPQGWKPFAVQKDEDGNHYLAMTVKHGWNTGVGRGKNKTERAELLTQRREVFGRTVWYGYRMRSSEGNPFTANRLLFSQYYLRLENLGTKNPIPLVAIKYDVLTPDSLRIEYYPCEGTINSALYSRFGDEPPYQQPYCNDFGSLPGKYEVAADPTQVQPLSLERQWINYVVGVRLTNEENGFVEVYQNKQLVFRWNGPTYGYSKEVPAEIKFGPYRNTNPRKGEKYPPQTFHIDDFVIGSSKDDVTKVLWN